MTDNHTQSTSEVISEDLKQLVIARLNVIPNGVKVSVGAEGDFTRDELIDRVKEGDSVGRQVMRSQLEFLQALGEGRFLDDLTSSP